MKSLYYLVFILLINSRILNAQDQRCGTIEYIDFIKKEHPEVINDMLQVEKFTTDWINNNPSYRRQTGYNPIDATEKSRNPQNKSLCGYDNNYFTTISAPTSLGQIQSPSPNCTYGGEFVRVDGLIAGRVYRISTVGLNNFDTQLTIWTAGGAYEVAHNDDWSGTQSEIYFNPLVSGSYDILIDEYNCISNTLCASLQVQLFYIPRPVITIPVVVHVVHNGEPIGTGKNLSVSQIESQIDVLNEDFRRLNPDIYSTPAAFRGASDDQLIEFCLAKQDEFGLPTNGIDRIQSSQQSWDYTSINNSLKPNTIWNRDSYLNIWTLEFGGQNSNLLGFAQFPGMPSNTDGVVISYKSFGKLGSAEAPYNLGKTATHEVGHWLNLRHVWGDENDCAVDDSISDTPIQTLSSSNCLSFPSTDVCSPAYPGIMFMNYMDYSNDDCLSMFTYGQHARIDAALFGPRASLLSSIGCTPSSVSVENLELLKNVSIYPNPTSGKFKLELLNLHNTTITIFNVLGDKILESSVDNGINIIDLDSRSKGVYFIKINSDEGVTSRKIIIE